MGIKRNIRGDLPLDASERWSPVLLPAENALLVEMPVSSHATSTVYLDNPLSWSTELKWGGLAGISTWLALSAEGGCALLAAGGLIGIAVAAGIGAYHLYDNWDDVTDWFSRYGYSKSVELVIEPMQDAGRIAYYRNLANELELPLFHFYQTGSVSSQSPLAFDDVDSEVERRNEEQEDWLSRLLLRRRIGFMHDEFSDAVFTQPLFSVEETLIGGGYTLEQWKQEYVYAWAQLDIRLLARAERIFQESAWRNNAAEVVIELRESMFARYLDRFRGDGNATEYTQMARFLVGLASSVSLKRYWTYYLHHLGIVGIENPQIWIHLAYILIGVHHLHHEKAAQVFIELKEVLSALCANWIENNLPKLCFSEHLYDGILTLKWIDHIIDIEEMGTSYFIHSARSLFRNIKGAIETIMMKLSVPTILPAWQTLQKNREILGLEKTREERVSELERAVEVAVISYFRDGATVAESSANINGLVQRTAMILETEGRTCTQARLEAMQMASRNVYAVIVEKWVTCQGSAEWRLFVQDIVGDRFLRPLLQVSGDFSDQPYFWRDRAGGLVAPDRFTDRAYLEAAYQLADMLGYHCRTQFLEDVESYLTRKYMHKNYLIKRNLINSLKQTDLVGLQRLTMRISKKLSVPNPFPSLQKPSLYPQLAPRP